MEFYSFSPNWEVAAKTATPAGTNVSERSKIGKSGRLCLLQWNMQIIVTHDRKE
jgi:hypothetical protein